MPDVAEPPPVEVMVTRFGGPMLEKMIEKFPGVGGKPATVRFDVVNALDSIYEIRNGSGVGVFAPQFGPRRGFFAGLSQKF